MSRRNHTAAPHPRRRGAASARGALLCAVVGGALTLAGCHERRTGLPRGALDDAWAGAAPVEDALPSLAEVLRLRAPEPAAAPTTLTGGNAAQAFARGEAVTAAVPGSSDGANDRDGAAVACLHAHLTRDYDRVVAACIAFAATWPADPRAVVATHVVASHRGSLPEPARRALLASLPRLVLACAAARTTTPGASCAELAIAVDDAVRGLATSLGDRAALLAARPGGDLQQATAEGPFLNADEALAGGPLATRPLALHPRFRVFDVEAAEGMLTPSRRGVGGWWRLTLRGEATAARRGVLAVRAAGALEVRLDGVPVLVRRPEDPRAAIELTGVDVGAGVHVVEVLAQESGRGVRVGAFDDDGQPLWRPVPRQRWARTAAASVVERAATVAMAQAGAPTDRGDTTALVSLLFAHTRARAGLGATPDDERVLARRLVDVFGWSTPALVAAAQTVEDDALPDRVASALAAPLWVRVLQQWPKNPLALLSQARAAVEERPEEALARFRAVVAAAPAYPIGRRELIDALLERDVLDEARDNALALLALGETNENIDAAAPALRASGDVLRARQLEALRLRRTTEDDDSRALLLAGDVDGARAKLWRLLQRGDDRALERWLDLVELGDPKAALRTLDEAVRRFPNDVGLPLRRAQLVARIEGPSAALRALDTLSTTDTRALRLRAAWGGEAPTGDHAARGDAAIAARLAAATPPLPGFPTVFLLDDFERRFADDGTSIAVRHWVAELRTKDALDAFGELRVDNDEILVRLRVQKPDGSVIEPERHAGVDDVSLPGLAPGDIVEFLSWTVESSARDGFAWETRSLQRAAPAVSRRYVVELPEVLVTQRQVRVLAENGAPSPATTLVGPPERRRVRHVFVSDGAPPLLDEPGAVDRLESEPQGGVVIDVDDDVFRRRRALPFRSSSRPDPWLVDVAARVGGKGSDTERLQRIFRFVAQNVVDADGPADAVGVLAVGRGLRQPLFHALAAAAGVPVQALGLHGTLELERRIPSARAFPVVVTRVLTDGEPHIIAFVDGAALWDGLSPWFQAAETIDLHDGTRGVLDDRHLERSAPEVVVDLAVTEAVKDGAAGRALRGVVALRLPTYLAGHARAGLRQVTEARLAQVLEAALGATLPGVKVTRVATPGLGAEGRPLSLVAGVDLPLSSTTLRLEHVFAGGALAAFNLAPAVGSWSTVAERHRALLLPPGGERLEFRLRVPPRTAFLDVPPDVMTSAGPISLRQKVSVFDDGLTWERVIDRRGARVPTADWPEVRAALAPLVTQVDARIGLVLPPSP